MYTTLWQVPAHARVNVTIIQYDSGSPLRNQQLGQVSGTSATSPAQWQAVPVIDSNSGPGVAHTFSIPSIGVNVPLYAIPQPHPVRGGAVHPSSPHHVITFSFTSPGPWQLPVAVLRTLRARFPLTVWGPMSTLGYMGGFMQVTA